MKIEFTVPVPTYANPPRHSWRSQLYGNKKAKMVGSKEQRETARISTRARMNVLPWPIILPVRITLCRLGPKTGALMDRSNLGKALKHVQDGIATALDITDRDRRDSPTGKAEWEHTQRRDEGVGVEVTIEEIKK